MKHLILFENFEDRNQIRAGLIPYIKEDGLIKMLFFIPSDPAYGGDKFQIAKGRVDNNEDIEAASIREASEELGLKKDNIKLLSLVSKEVLSGMGNYKYDFYLYVAEVYNKDNFDAFSYETAQISWLTMEEYEHKGRRSQLEIVKKCYNKIINI